MKKKTSYEPDMYRRIASYRQSIAKSTKRAAFTSSVKKEIFLDNMLPL